MAMTAIAKIETIKSVLNNKFKVNSNSFYFNYHNDGSMGVEGGKIISPFEEFDKYDNRSVINRTYEIMLNNETLLKNVQYFIEDMNTVKKDIMLISETMRKSR